MSTEAHTGATVAEFDQMQAEGCEIVRAARHTVVVIGDRESVIAIEREHAPSLIRALRAAADEIEDAYVEEVEHGDD